LAGLLDDLITLLREQVNDFLDLAALATEKREAIIKNDVEHLQTIVNIENSIVGRNQKADRRRIELMKDVATVLNSDSNTLTISHLANLLEGKPGQDELIEVGEALREAADELKKINEQNSGDYCFVVSLVLLHKQ
jgi:flagellar biosynthesis/type III secretory pathway chaperone